jgi:hypothetical protein
MTSSVPPFTPSDTVVEITGAQNFIRGYLHGK